MRIHELDALQAQELAAYELGLPHPNMKRFGKLVEQMCADIPNDERTWRYAGHLYERAGWYEQAVAAYTRCGELGNETAVHAIAAVQVKMQRR